MTKHSSLHLTNDERIQLDRLISSGNAPARTQTRARILLLTDHSQGMHRTKAQIAQALLCAPATVQNVTRRCLQEGVQAALGEKPRPGAAPKVTGEVEARLTLLACSEAPAGRARWTVRLLANRTVELGYVDSLSHTAVAQALKKTKSSLGA